MSHRCMFLINICLLFIRLTQHCKCQINYLFVTFTMTCFGRSFRPSSSSGYDNLKEKKLR